MAYQGNQINYNNLNEELKNKIDKTEDINAIKTKVDNSWQKGVYNDTNISNVGAVNATRTIMIHPSDWKSSTNVEQLDIYLPISGAFSGIIKATYTSTWGNLEAWGGTEVVYEIGSFLNSGTKLNKFTIVTASEQFMKSYKVITPYIDESTGNTTLLLMKAPRASNPLRIKLEIQGYFHTTTQTAFDVLKNASFLTNDTGSPTYEGYPWTPQRSQIPTASEIAFWNVGMWDDIVNGRDYPINGILTNLATLKPSQFRDFLTNLLPRRTGTFKCFVNTPDVGAPSINGYGILTTIKPWVDESGGGLTQKFEAADVIHKRFQIDADTWSAWVRIQDSNVDVLKLFQSVSNGKSQVANAITQKGVPTSADAEFATMANNIGQIQTGGKKAEFDLVFTNITSGSIQSVTTPPFNFQPMNSSSNLIGAHILNGQAGSLEGLGTFFINGMVFAEKCIINNLGGGNYSVTVTARNRETVTIPTLNYKLVING